MDVKIHASCAWLRLARDLSQDELADSAGMRQALVSAIEVGTANPTLNSLESLALALGVTVGDLLAGGGKQK